MQPQPPSSAASVAAAAAAEAPAVDLPPPPPHSRRSCGSSSWLRLGRSRRVSALSNHHSSKATRSKACANKSSQKISNSNNSNMMMYSSTSPPHCSSFSSSASSPPPLSSSPSLLTWLETTCPPELVPKILAMAGPHTMRSMLGVNRYWKHVMQDDDNATTTTTTWKSICQETNKWQDGDELPTGSWKQFYQDSPCVPVDYSSIPAALAAATMGSSSSKSSRWQSYHQLQTLHCDPKRIRILLQPGRRYTLHETLLINLPEHVSVSIETLPRNKNAGLEDGNNGDGKRLAVTSSTSNHRNDAQVNSPSSSPRKQRKKLRWNCKGNVRDHVHVDRDDDEGYDHDGDEEEEEEDEGATDSSLTEQEASRHDHHHHQLGMSLIEHETFHSSPSSLQNCATILFKTRRLHNAPAIWMQQGRLSLCNLHILHSSLGMDIWNGNAAIQLQPTTPTTTKQASCELNNCLVTSKSGRGIVCMDGASVQLTKSAVYKCAATGVYIGGFSSRAVLKECDVLLNGMGSRLRGGIARGHSGIYVEQGMAKICQSSICHNSLTGISVVSPDHASLRLEASELVWNGTFQLEWSAAQQEQSVSGRSSELNDNHMAVQGAMRLRSGQLVVHKVRRGLVRNVLRQQQQQQQHNDESDDQDAGVMAAIRRPVMGPLEAGWQ